MTEVTHDGPEDFREQYPDLADTPGLLLRHQKQPEPYDGGYETRLQTPNTTLDPDTMGVLSEKGYAVQYLGFRDGAYEWQLHEEESSGEVSRDANC